MAKKKAAKTPVAKSSAKTLRPKRVAKHDDVPVTKQTAGAVTGAVLGGVVAGPVGALAGGAVGALVGDSSDKGKKPIKRAFDAIREEVTSGRAKQALKSVGEKIKSLRPSKKKKKTATSKKSANEYSNVPSIKKKAKTAKRSGGSAKSVKAATPRPKKRAKKKS